MLVGARLVQVNQLLLRVGGRGPTYQHRRMHEPSASVRRIPEPYEEMPFSLEEEIYAEVLP